MGTRRPSSSCWPSAQDTCVWLTLEPLAPEMIMQEKALWGKGTYSPCGRHTLKISEEMGDTIDFITLSISGPTRPRLLMNRLRSSFDTAVRRCSSVRPLSSSSRLMYRSRPATAFSSAPSISARRFCSASSTSTRSSIEHVNPRFWK